MRKEFKNMIFTPLPVLMIGTYDEHNVPNVMNAAWGGQIDANQFVISLSKHKTTDNLLLKKEFTLSFATAKTVNEADYFGIRSGKKTDKVAFAGFHHEKAPDVDAPVFEEFPLCLECRVLEMKPDGDGYLLYGEAIKTLADESILTDGKADLGKLGLIMFDSAMNVYRVIGEPCGKAFRIGLDWEKSRG